jgi:hypothetical protein
LLSVNTPPVIKTQPVSVTAIQGVNIKLSVTATGAAPLGYQWRKDGVALAGATASSFTIRRLDACMFVTVMTLLLLRNIFIFVAL